MYVWGEDSRIKLWVCAEQCKSYFIGEFHISFYINFEVVCLRLEIWNRLLVTSLILDTISKWMISMLGTNSRLLCFLSFTGWACLLLPLSVRDFLSDQPLSKTSSCFASNDQRHWTRISEPVGGRLSYKPPIYDINAPDLYIPFMAFGTYVVLAGLSLGLDGKYVLMTLCFSLSVLSLNGSMIQTWIHVGFHRKLWIGCLWKDWLVGFCKWCSWK